MASIPSKLYSVELESQLLAGLLRYPNEFFKIEPYIAPDVDFASQLKYTHRSIWYALQKLAAQNKSPDIVLILELIDANGVDLQEELKDCDLQDYLEGLQLRQINQKSVEDIARALKVKTFQRQRWMAAARMAKALEKDKFDNVESIIEVCDQHYSSGKEFWNGKFLEPVNLLDNLESMVEERGNNPPKTIGLMGPHPEINRMFGPIIRPGNLTVIAARSGGHKTAFVMDYLMKVMDIHEIPILHLDNGEMSENELEWRMASSLSNVPFHLIESGQWRQNKEMVERVRSTWPRVRELKKIGYYYYSVGGYTTERLLSVAQKWYLTHVGRDQENKCAMAFDYLKTGNERGNRQEWLLFHDAMIKWKNFTRYQCPIGAFIPVQENRSGVVGNKKAHEVVADQSSIGMSDGINTNASWVLILKEKTLDELAAEEGKFGTVKLFKAKARFLGEGAMDILTPVKMPDGKILPNWINFNITNFNAKEMGTGRTVAKYLEGKLDAAEDDGDDISIDI